MKGRGWSTRPGDDCKESVKSGAGLTLRISEGVRELSVQYIVDSLRLTSPFVSINEYLMEVLRSFLCTSQQQLHLMLSDLLLDAHMTC